MKKQTKMWFNYFNFRRRAAQTALCLAQCVKNSDSLVSAVRLTLTTLYLVQCVKYSCILVGAMRFTLTADRTVCLMQCVKYSCSLIGGNTCYMPTASPRRGLLFISSPRHHFSLSRAVPGQIACLFTLFTQLIKSAVLYR